MTDTFEFTLNNPLTEEQWDQIADVDFDRTNRIWFHTKHGKEVEFAKVIRCKDCKHWDGYYCHNKWWGDGYGNYTPPIKSEDGFCDWAEGKENGKID